MVCKAFARATLHSPVVQPAAHLVCDTELCESVAAAALVDACACCLKTPYALAPEAVLRATVLAAPSP